MGDGALATRFPVVGMVAETRKAMDFGQCLLNALGEHVNAVRRFGPAFVDNLVGWRTDAGIDGKPKLADPSVEKHDLIGEGKRLGNFPSLRNFRANAKHALAQSLGRRAKVVKIGQRVNIAQITGAGVALGTGGAKVGHNRLRVVAEIAILVNKRPLHRTLQKLGKFPRNIR